MRILVTVTPQMYREAVAIAILRHRPDAEILIASPEYLDGQAKSFAPHAVVRNDDGEELGVPEGVACWVWVKITESSMDARISVGGRETHAPDATVEELVRALDEAEALVT